MQKGETEGFDAAAHLSALLTHAGDGVVDSIIVQLPALPDDGVEVAPEVLSADGVRVVQADVAEESGAHHAGRLAAALSGLSGPRQ